MVNIIHCIRTLSIACVLSAIVQNNCYAKRVTTTIEISIPCSPTPEEALSHPQIYPGAPDTWLSLTTKGIKVEGQEELIKDSFFQNNSILVVAKCTEPGGFVAAATNMFIFSEQSSTTIPPMPALHCKKRQGIEVIMSKPNDPNPNKYKYVADLTITSYIHDKSSSGATLVEPRVETTPSYFLGTSSIINTEI
jgi:hypothetical protein